MNRWDTLTMSEKNQLLGIYASKGYNNLANIIAHYNSFAEGGNVDGKGDDIDNRTGKPKYRRDIQGVNITSSSNSNIEGAARDTNTIGPLAFYPPKYYISRQGNQFAENPNVTYDSWFDEHPEMIDVMTDIVGKYNNRLNNRGQQLPQLNRFYFEKLYNPEDDPIIHEAIERMLQAKWNRDVRTYNDNRTLNLWDTVEKFPVTTVKEPQEYANGGHLFAFGTPDWDPDNPYHYHTDKGEKVVITPEDWEANKGKSYFKEVEDAVNAERAAHPGPEYEIDPKFVSALSNNYASQLANTSGALNYRNFARQLPEGYTINNQGVVFDTEGNAYVQDWYNGGNRYTYDKNNPTAFTFTFGPNNQRNVNFYPVNMEKRIKAPLPVDETMNVAAEKEKVIQDNMRYLFPDIGDRMYYYPDHLWPENKNGKVILKSGTKDEYNNIRKKLKEASDRTGNNYVDEFDKGIKKVKPNINQVVIPIKTNNPKQKRTNGLDVYDWNPADGELDLRKTIRTEDYINDAIINKVIKDTQKRKAGGLEDLIDDFITTSTKPSRKEAEKNAVIPIKYATGGHLYQDAGWLDLPATPGTTPVNSSSTYVQPRLITDEDLDKWQGLPKGTTTMRRYSASRDEMPVIKQTTVTRKQQDKINKAAKKQKVINNISNVLDVAEYAPLFGDAITFGRSVSDATNGNYTGLASLPLILLGGSKVVKPVRNFTKNRQFAKNYDFDDVMNNLLEREGRDVGVYANSKHIRDNTPASIASMFTPESVRPTLDLSLNPIKYFHNGENPLKMSFKKTLRDILSNSENLAYNSANVVRVNPTSWFNLTPTEFKGLLGHEGQHSVQNTLPVDLSLATYSKKYYINNPDNVYTREVLQPFERNNEKWIGSPNELDSEIINWKIQNNIPLSTDFINMDNSLQKKFADLTKKRFNLKEDEAFNILYHLSRNGYFQNGGYLGRITPYGQWQYPHQVTTIPSNNITMQGVDYPVIGISNTGDVKYMLPNMDYLFDGQYVTEYPIK